MLQAQETKLSFLSYYAAATAQRLKDLTTKDDRWFEDEIAFFDVRRSRAWAFTRRITHSAHHRAQLQMGLRAWGVALYSNYGPSADTGGPAVDGGRVICRYASIDELLEQEIRGGSGRPLPGPPGKPVSERGIWSLPR